MPKRSSKGRLDLNQLAKSIVDQATGDETKEPEQSDKNPAAVALGRLGGKKGGKARAEKLTPSSARVGPKYFFTLRTMIVSRRGAACGVSSGFGDIKL